METEEALSIDNERESVGESREGETTAGESSPWILREKGYFLSFLAEEFHLQRNVSANFHSSSRYFLQLYSQISTTDIKRGIMYTHTMLKTTLFNIA